MKKKLIIYLLISLPFLANAQNPIDSLQKYIKLGNQLYDSSEYLQAIKYYDKVYQNGYLAAELFYNMANAYYKSGDIPNSIYYYEKALLLDYHNKKIKDNLKFVNSKLKNNTSTTDIFILDKIYLYILTTFSSNTWATISFILFTLTLIGSLIFFLSSNIRKRKIAFILGMIFFIFSILSYFFAYQMDKYQNSGKYAIVMEISTVRSSPNNTGTELYVLQPGVKVKLIDREGQWYEVELPNNKTGWIPETNIKRIKL